jgi:hypothetical protein
MKSRIWKRLLPAPASAKLRALRKLYGGARWRKRKGIARVQLRDGSEHLAEIHWYEAAGVGRKEFKIKEFL